MKGHIGIRIIEESGDQAHGGAHQTDGGADDRRFKEDGMRLFRIEYLACEQERASLPHDYFERVSEAKLDEDDRPYREESPEHEHAALCVDRRDIERVYHVKTVKDISVYGYDNG